VQVARGQRKQRGIVADLKRQRVYTAARNYYNNYNYKYYYY